MSQSFYCSDKELLIAAIAGNDNAFRSLYDKYWLDLFQMAYRRLRNAEEAKDITQEVFIAFWNNIRNIRTGEEIAGYLYVALRNKIFNHYQKKNVRLQHLMAQTFDPVDSEESVLSVIQSKELQNYLRTLIAGLPSRMKQIYLLSKEEELAISEIAGLLQLSTQTVKNQLHKALTRIRTDLKKHQLDYLYFHFL